MTWRERLENGVTSENVELARKWETCAVGEQHAMYPEVVRYEDLAEDPAPLDGVLRDWGYDFYLGLKEDNLTKARAALDGIEDRVLELKRGIEMIDSDSIQRDLNRLDSGTRRT